MVKVIENFCEISQNYRVIFCDLWGCIHNGKESFQASLKALLKFRKNGGLVILLTNAPRPREDVVKFIDTLGITNKFYDDIITSGDATQSGISTGEYGQKLYHIGPSHDLRFFKFKDSLERGATQIKLVPISEASSILCTGLFNDQIETPSDYEEILEFGILSKLPLLCANPDLQVDYGNRRLWCAGALAQKYTEAGGNAIYFGKPHKPIYDLAISQVHKINSSVNASEIICVGDGIFTDILGGHSYGLDTLFVAGGLSSQDTGVIGKVSSPDIKMLFKFFKKVKFNPTASIGYFQ